MKIENAFIGFFVLFLASFATAWNAYGATSTGEQTVWTFQVSKIADVVIADTDNELQKQHSMKAPKTDLYETIIEAKWDKPKDCFFERKRKFHDFIEDKFADNPNHPWFPWNPPHWCNGIVPWCDGGDEPPVGTPNPTAVPVPSSLGLLVTFGPIPLFLRKMC